MPSIIEKVSTEIKERIEEEGEIMSNSILSVDSFLNHQIDPELIDRIGKAIAERFREKKITKVVTAAASGISIAYSTARALERKKSRDVYSIYAKKGIPKTLENGITREVKSATGGEKVELVASRNYLKGERVLITDDFLSSGNTSEALTEICEEAGATIVGYAFAISKEFSKGRKRLEKRNYPIFAVARIDSIGEKTVKCK